MALQKQLHEYTEDELNERVEFDIFHDNKHNKFHVLRVLLTAYVPSLDSLFRFSDIKSVKLTGISPQTFSIFLGWLRYEHYSCEGNSLLMGIQPYQHGWFRGRSESGAKLREFDWHDENGFDYYDYGDSLTWEDGNVVQLAEAAIEMFIFAGKYEIPWLRQDAIDRLVWCHNRFEGEQHSDDLSSCVGATAMTRAYQNTQPDAPIRKLLVEGYYEFGFMGEIFLSMPEELVKDVARMLVEDDVQDDAQGFGPWEPCDYHEHATTAEKEACVVRVMMDRAFGEDITGTMTPPGRKFAHVMAMHLQARG